MTPSREYLDLSDIDDRSSALNAIGWNNEMLRQARVMVIGAGALGNEVLKNLALIGVEQIVIVDFDVIERSNLAKSVLFREQDCDGEHLKGDLAAKRIKEINPAVRTMVINGDITIDIGLGVFRRMDAIICCVDNRLTRLSVNRFSHWLDKTWIDGGIEDLGGQLTVFKPGVSCYECQLSPQAWANIQFRMGCTTRAMRYASAGIANTTPITSSVIGAMQVQEALKQIASATNGDHSLAGQQFYYEGMSNTYLVLPASHLKEICHSHRRFSPIISAPSLSSRCTVKELFQWLNDHFNDPELIVSLHYELVLTLGTEHSQKEIEYIKPRQKLTQSEMNQFQEVEGEEVRITRLTYEIGEGFPHPDLILEELGIPPLHILSVVSQGEQYYVELTGDEAYLSFS